MVVVTADHGEEFQEHGKLKHGMQLYEESVRVPLVIAGPGVAAGRTGAQTQSVDVFPTVAAMLGAPAPAGLPGRDALAPDDAARPAFLEARAAPGDGGPPVSRLAVRVPGWKLVRDPVTGHTALFDLAHDPGEHEDVGAGAPEAARLGALLDDWLAHAPPPPHPEARDPALDRKLRALGYTD